MFPLHLDGVAEGHGASIGNQGCVPPRLRMLDEQVVNRGCAARFLDSDIVDEAARMDADLEDSRHAHTPEERKGFAQAFVSGVDHARAELLELLRWKRWRSRAPAEHRSEEHTSELQSLAYLVCRLLLEKK